MDRQLVFLEKCLSRQSFRDFTPSMAISLLTDTANFHHEKYFSVLGHIYAAVENLAIPSHAEVQKLASISLSPVKAEEYLLYLKTLYAFLLKFRFHNLATEDRIVNCNMHNLLDFHMVSKETRKIASKLVCEAYGTFDACLKSNNMVNVLLFLEHRLHVRNDVTTIFELPSEENWLQRNILHTVAIFVHEQEVLRFIPKAIIERFINTKDLHGCTPLHVAYLHENQHVVQFLKCHGASEDIADNFGMVPKAAEPNFAVLEYKKLCCEITESSGDVFRKITPMLIMSPAKAEDQAEEMKRFLEHLMRNTEYCQSVEKIVVAGSLRDKLKVGLLDEADVQVRFKSSLFVKRSFNDNLIKGLKTMNWDDIHLRPICMTNPWVLQWEKPGPLQGIKVSVDVVPIFETGFMDRRSFAKQRQILSFAKMHKECYFLKLKRVEEGLCNTYFSYEWDILDQVSMACRLGILIAKALLQAYYVAKGLDQSPLKKPITSYMVKTAVFYILAWKKRLETDHKDADLKDADHKDVDHKDADHKDADHKDPDQKDADHKDVDHMDADHKDADHKDPDHKDAEHNDAEHKDADHKDPDHKAADHKDADQKDPYQKDANHKDVDHMDADLKDADQKDADHMDVAYKDADHKDADHKDPYQKDADHKDVDHKDADHKDVDQKDTDHKDAYHKGVEHTDADHKDPDQKDADHNDADHKDPDPKDAGHKDLDQKNADQKDPHHTDADHKDVDHKDVDHTDADHTDVAYKDADYKDADHMEADHKDVDHKDVFPKRAVRWIGEEDLEKHAEEGRVWAIKIFEFIRYECCRGGMKYYWNDELYLVKGDEGKDVIKLCNNLLERLEFQTFHNKFPKAALRPESAMVGQRESVPTTSCNERQIANERSTRNIDHLDQTKPHQSQCNLIYLFNNSNVGSQQLHPHHFRLKSKRHQSAKLL